MPLLLNVRLVDDRGNFLDNASQCREAMEALLVDAFAYRRARGRIGRNRDAQQQNTRCVLFFSHFPLGTALHTTSCVFCASNHTHIIISIRSDMYLALPRNHTQDGSSSTIRSDARRVSSVISPARSLASKPGSTSEDLTDSEVSLLGLSCAEPGWKTLLGHRRFGIILFCARSC